MIPTVSNIASYVEKFGVDDYIGNYLMTEYDPNSGIVFQGVESVDKTTREELAFKLLNASEEHVPSSVRVSLARQLTLEENEWDSSKIQRVIVREEPLLAFGLKAGLFPDDFNTFNYFVQGGWEAVEDAFKVSKNISSFINPSLTKGFITEFLESDKVPIDLKLMAVEKSDEYVPSGDSEALRAVGKIAKEENIKLPVGEIKHIARVVKDPDLVLHQLAQQKADLNADDLMSVMGFLKKPYDKLRGPSGTMFNLPKDPSARILFRHLAGAGKVKIEQEKPRARKKVRVL